MANLKEGIILYQIEKNGCLNGSYTNEMQDGIIYNEIARHKTAKNIKICSEELPLEGEYDSLYFDDGNERGELCLEIKLLPKKKGTYKFVWTDDQGKQYFEGIGYKMNEHQLVVHYKV